MSAEDRLRKLELLERIAAAAPDAFEPRLEKRVLGRGKWQLVDHDERECMAAHIHALPEARRAEEHGIAELPKAPQQRLARRLALHEHRKTLAEAGHRVEDLFRLAERAMAREQQEAPAACGRDERQRGA